MTIKVRKVGNSMVLTVPSHIAESFGMYEGQPFTAAIAGQSIEYRPLHSKKNRINWSKYALGESNLRDGKTPEKYVRSLRDNDR